MRNCDSHDGRPSRQASFNQKLRSETEAALSNGQTGTGPTENEEVLTAQTKTVEEPAEKSFEKPLSDGDEIEFPELLLDEEWE